MSDVIRSKSINGSERESSGHDRSKLFEIKGLV